MEDISPNQLKSILTGEFSRAREKLREEVEGFSKKELKRLLLTFTGLYHNDINLNEKEQKFIEYAALAMENFIGNIQAEGEIPNQEELWVRKFM